MADSILQRVTKFVSYMYKKRSPSNLKRCPIISFIHDYIIVKLMVITPSAIGSSYTHV